MLTRIFISLFFLVLPLIQPFSFKSAMADEQYERCIQKQLSSLTFDVGEIDGKIGSKTRHGILKLKQDDPSFDNLPTLSKATAPIWCRVIGEQKNLDSYWPSQSIEFKVDFLGDVGHGFRMYLQNELNSARSFIETKLEIRLIGTPKIFVSSDLKLLSKAVYEAAGRIDDLKSLQSVTKKYCSTATFTGTSYDKILALCFGKQQASSWFRYNSKWIKRIVSHELAHEFHGQYVGFYRHISNRTQISKRGPKWLTEGLMTAIELKFANPNTTFKFFLSDYADREEYTGKRLRQFSNTSISKGREFANYVGYAGLMLASKNSLSSIGKFWKLTPILGWDKAFTEAFGMTSESFYKKFGSE